MIMHIQTSYKKSLFFITVLFFFIILQLFFFQKDNFLYPALISVFLTIPALVYLLVKNHDNFLKTCFFLIISLQFVINLYLPLTFCIYLLIISFTPLIFIHSYLNDKFTVPFKIPFGFLLIGFLSTITHSIITNKFDYNYPLSFDVYLLIGIIITIVFFHLLNNNLIKYETIIISLILSGLLLTLLIIISYINNYSAALIFKERLGFSIKINPNLISTYLNLILPLALFRVFDERSKYKAFFFFCCSFLFGIEMLLTSSRGCLPGLALAVIISFWKCKSIPLKILILTTSIFVLFIFGNLMITRIFEPTINDYLSNAGRLEMINSANKILQSNNYIFGIGLDNYRIAKFNFGFPSWFDPNKLMSSHNFYLEIWMGWGIFGFIGWIILLIESALITIKKSNSHNFTCQSVFFSILSVSLQGLVDSFLANLSVMFVVFILFAVIFYLFKTNTQLKS